MTRSNPRPRAPVPAGGRRLPFDIAPAISAVGLVVVAVVSFALLGGSLPSLPGDGNSGPGGPVHTPTPSNVVVVPDDPRAKFPGRIVYVKDGNLWVQSGTGATQVTGGGRYSMPTWSPDGQWIYFVRTASKQGKWPSGGEVRTYNLTVPSLDRLPANGSGQPDVLLTGDVTKGTNTWSYFIRQPSISPDGTQAAIITDGPDPTKSDIVLKIVDLATGTITDPRLGQSQGLGHQDPAWSPDGTQILFTRNAREGARGTPAIYRYTIATGKSSAVTGPGYMAPAWSRDGRYIAATQTSQFGTDIVILDAANGAELLRVTRDEASFNPVWSPMGDAVAYFRVEHGLVDLYLVKLEGTPGAWTAGEPVPLTVSAGLQAASRPSWFVPADQLPPLPTPTSGPAASPSGTTGPAGS